MLIRDIFNRFEKEWDYLEKMASQSEESVLSKIPFHDSLKDQKINFILKKPIPDSNKSDLSQTRLLNDNGYKYIVKFELNNNETIDYKKKKLFQGLTIEFETTNNNIIIAILASEHKNRPQFSLLLSYLSNELQSKDFLDALECTLKYLKNYWSISTLSKEFQLGLFGELHILEMLIDKIGWEKATKAWKGPDSGLHDFNFDNTLIEIKTTESDPQIIRIQNPAQLYIPDNQILYLNVCSAEIGKGCDIVEKVKQLQYNYEGYEKIDSVFNQKLVNVGYFNHLITGGLLKITITKSTQVKLIDSEMVLSKNIIDSLPDSVKNIRYNLDYSLFDPNDTNLDKWLE